MKSKSLVPDTKMAFQVLDKLIDLLENNYISNRDSIRLIDKLNESYKKLIHEYISTIFGSRKNLDQIENQIILSNKSIRRYNFSEEINQKLEILEKRLDFLNYFSKLL